MNATPRLHWLAARGVLLATLAGCAPSTPPASSAPTPAASSRSATHASLADVHTRPPDAFYDPPADVPARPGVLLRSEPLTGVTLPSGMRGFRLLYTTTIDDITRATAVATVFAPASSTAGPRPVIMWEHGTTGLLQKCMPSLISAPTEGIPARDTIVRAGWVIVATDYSFAEKGGPHPYLIGEGEARAALDAVRAARQMPELALAARTVVWGHPQGGHAALWTGSVGPRYAPEVEIVGVAALAPAANMQQLLALNVAVDHRLGPYIARAYSRFYPDIGYEQALRPEALAAARAMSELCAFFPREDVQRMGELLSSFEGPALATSTNTALAARLAENTATGAIPAPVLIVQGLDDPVVPPRATDAYVAARCAAGQALEYWTLAGIDHGAIVAAGSPLEGPLETWTDARFAGTPPPRGCSQRTL